MRLACPTYYQGIEDGYAGKASRVNEYCPWTSWKYEQGFWEGQEARRTKDTENINTFENTR